MASRSAIALVILALGSSRAAADGPPRPVGFSRDVRPILAANCLACHGPDAATREAGLRLDRRADATAVLPDSGVAAIVPGDPEASELAFRVTVDDDLLRMPPPSTGKRLTADEVAVLERWIAQGAPFDEHWSSRPPVRLPLPRVEDAAWVRNPIDAFLLARLEAEGLRPSPEADRLTLLRRLSLDLTGLPPTVDDADAFAADGAPDAYERRVERLLASPHHGERLAVPWLDLVRFADTVGYHSDVNRSIALYRDYVIKAFNDNLPFDRFTVEQLAGDLLPEPTAWQRVASAYNMLGMTTEEGGAQPKEYLARYAADRVRNAGSVWMGATLACAECHDHKYDPYSTRDFYAFSAFFADIQQQGTGTPKPSLAMPTPEQAAALARLDAELAALGVDQAADRERIQQERARIDAAVRRTIVTVPGPPRITRVLHRGDWMDESGEVVAPAIPEAMGSLPAADGRRLTRLDLARWLVATDPPHPQTARVAVNRLWRLFFGAGLTDTPDDLGTQGEWPSHPELLDWLAVEFVDSGWDVRHMIRLMVTSSAYRQSSGVRNAEFGMRDSDAGGSAIRNPQSGIRHLSEGRLLARQASFRLEAEQVRDAALRAAGLLDHRLGGESVRPYQPAGHWRFLNFPTREYVPSTGADQYRRGLYTHWQRTLLHPSLVALDAPSREQCTAKRPISNTPQAALALLNDPSHVEAARALAALALAEGGSDDEARLTWIWRRVLIRPPADAERALLADLLAGHRRQYGDDPEAARALRTVGQAPTPSGLDPAELAAWTSVARVVLNLDEAITRD